MRTSLLITAFCLIGCSSPPPAATEVKIQSVKWPQLQSAIAAHKGKVVVIDLWAEF